MNKLPVPELSRFLAPRSVALIGATDDMKKFSGRCLHQMITFGYQGTIYPVNPSRTEVRGLKCYPSLLDLPEPPDHVGIAVAPERAIEVVRQCGEKGLPFATVFTSGFMEAGNDRGRELQAELLEVARQGNVRIMGPNCNGTINFVERFAMTSSPSASGDQPPPGNIAVISHSGGVGHINVMWRALELGLGLNYVVTCGNDADLDLLDFAAYSVEQDRVGVVLLVAERISDGAKFTAFARRAAELGKPVVAIKLGRTEAGSKAAASHTGALTGTDAVCDAAFRQYGVIRVEDCNELYEMAMLLRTRRWAKGRRACGISTTGGNIVLASDLGATRGIEWPEYSAATQASLKEITGVGPFPNPTDTTTAAHGVPGMYRRALETIAADERIDIVMPILNFPPAADVDHVQQLALNSDKPVAVCWVGGAREENAMTRRQLVESGVSVHRDVLPCLKAMRASADYGAFITRQLTTAAVSRPAGCDTAAVKKLLAGRKALSEHEAHGVLNAYGIPTVQATLARTAEQAVAAVKSMGAPAALKICSPDIPHKTEADGIRLDVEGDVAVREAFDAIMGAAKAYAPKALIDGVLVQPMAPRGLEIMLGVVRDLSFGPVVVAAHGGIYVELMRDAAYRIPPFDHAEARAMLQELRIHPLLAGGGRAPARDIDALADALVRLSWLAVDFADSIAELDVNPVIVGEQGKGLSIVDALVVPAT